MEFPVLRSNVESAGFYNPSLTELNSGRILALDIGKKRIGLAVSDELRLTGHGIDTLYRTRIREDLSKLQETCAHWNIGTLLIGRPLHMSGDESRQGEYTKEFADRLQKHVLLPVVWWDERLTSKEAERMLREVGATLAQKKKAVDRLSAVLLLESYLGFRQMSSQEAGENEFSG